MTEARRGSSLFPKSVSRLLSNRGAVIGIVLLVAIACLAFFSPALVQHDPLTVNAKARLLGPSQEHLFGTDAFGRDVFARVLMGGRVSLKLGFVAVGVASLIGITLGLLASYYGGVIDNLIMRLVDVMLAFPGILLALAIVAILGPSLTNAMIAVGISGSPTYTRVVRGAVLQVKAIAFVDAARQLGASDLRIIWRHIFPNVLAPIVVLATLGVANAIIAGAALSFLGLGAKPPTPEWGLMLADGRNYLRHAWWITTFPGVAIMLTVLSINLLGDGLRDALDPRMAR